MTRPRAHALLKSILLILPLLAAAACNTMEGVGEDIKNAGSWVEKKAGEKK